MITVTQKVYFARGAAGRRRMRLEPAKPRPKPKPRIPNIAKLMALAIRFDELLRDGTASDQAELAAMCHVSQPRISQILALNLLAPDIQEELLFLPAVECGKDQVHERLLRTLATEPDWARQRERWITTVRAVKKRQSQRKADTGPRS